MQNLGDFPRPSHRDFMTSSELKKDEFSGLRYNSLTSSMECWICGECVITVTEEEKMLNPNIFNEKYEDYFGLNNVELTAQKGN